MNTEIDKIFFYYVAILGSLVVAFTGFKIANCEPFQEGGEKFSLKKLVLGLAKHLIAVSSLSVVYVVCSLFGADLAVIKINGSEFTIPAALNLVMLATIVAYSSKLIKNAAEHFKVNDKFEKVEEKDVMPQTTFNTDPSVITGNSEDEAQG